jgi:hypothetical protein
MIPRKIVDDYRRMNFDDQSAFRRWLMTNAVVGGVSLFALIAIASIYPHVKSRSVAAQKGEIVLSAVPR